MVKRNNTNQEKVWVSKEEYIQQLAMRTNEVHISNNNSKTGPMCNDLALPLCSCREDSPCKEGGCYCTKGRQTMSNVVGAYARNLRLYNTDHEDFWEQVEFIIKHRPLPLFRWFDCGDIYDYDFFCGMVTVAKKFPHIKFMSFTKKYEIVNNWIDNNGELPKNLAIRFSAWHIGWEVPNPHNLPIAYVDFKDKTLNPKFPEKYHTCPNQSDKNITCSICQKCWNSKIQAVIFKQH